MCERVSILAGVSLETQQPIVVELKTLHSSDPSALVSSNSAQNSDGEKVWRCDREKVAGGPNGLDLIFQDLPQ